MNLENELNAVRQTVAEKTPPHVVPTIEATKQRLMDSGLVQGALQPGQMILNFELPDATEKLVKSSDLRQTGPLLILFYRGIWCPFCNLTVRAYQEQLQSFQNRAVTLVAISPQTSDHSLTLQEKHHLKFPVLSVAAYNGDNRYELPVPAAFLVSKTGEVIRSYVEVDYMKRLAPETALQWIDEVF
jgi:peroxiredoxin